MGNLTSIHLVPAAFACAGLLVICGCGERRSPAAVGASARGGGTATEDRAIAACAGQAYRQSDWDRDVAASVRLACAGLTRKGKTPDDPFRDRAARRARVASLQNAVNYMLVRGSAAGRAFDCDDAVLNRVRDRYSQSAFRQKGKFASLTNLVSSEDYQVIDHLARKTAVVESFLSREFAPKFRVSDSEIDAAWSNVVRLAELADQTNRTIRATAQDVVRRARGGEDFTRLVRAYSQDANSDENGFIEEKTESDFASDKPGVWAAVAKLKPGEVSEPLDSEEGLSIFKLARIEPPNDEHDEDWRILQRIVFHRMLKYPYETRDDLAMALQEKARREMGASAVRELVAENPVTFPTGVEGFSRDLLIMLRAYSRDIVVPEAKGLSGAYLKALQMKRKQRQPKNKENHESHEH